MKLIVLTLVYIAVFTANCRGRDIPDGPEVQAPTIGQEHLPYGPEDLGFTTDVDEGFQIKFSGRGQIQDEAENHVIPHEDERLKVEGKGKGKGKGGSTCKSDIVCSLLSGSCVSSSTYCSGREVPSVCSGSNCKCCIAVNLEVKVHDLETELRSMVVNLTVANSNLYSKMEAIMEFMISANSSQTIINSNIDLKIDSLTSNLTNTNSGINNEIQFIKENMTNANANANLKLDYIREYQECPTGLFLYAPTNQCFKMLNDTTRSWYAANTTCHAMGLELAQPYDPVSLRSYIISKYGLGTSNTWYWIGAKGDGSYIRWQRTGKYISSSSPLWWSGHPGSSVSTSYCLMTPMYESHWKSHPKAVYYSYPCSYSYHALCELRRE